jgi:hypothetical protein
MVFLFGMFVGLALGFGLAVPVMTVMWRGNDTNNSPKPRLPRGVRRGSRPDVRRVVLRPVNLDQPPSRITQALFRQRPTRKLDDDNARDAAD